jgi:hypothetical protein
MGANGKLIEVGNMLMKKINEEEESAKIMFSSMLGIYFRALRATVQENCFKGEPFGFGFGFGSELPPTTSSIRSPKSSPEDLPKSDGSVDQSKPSGVGGRKRKRERTTSQSNANIKRVLQEGENYFDLSNV